MQKNYQHPNVVIDLNGFLGSGYTTESLMESGYKVMIRKIKKELEITDVILIDIGGFYAYIPKEFYSRCFYGIRKKMGDKEFFRRIRVFSRYGDGAESDFKECSGRRYRSDITKKKKGKSWI